MTQRADLVQQIADAYLSPHLEQNELRLAKAQKAADRLKVSWDEVKAEIDKRVAEKSDGHTEDS